MPRLSTRDHIIKTAKDMIYHRGYGVTSYGEIFKVTGIAKGNIQYYFKSKEHLLLATLDQRVVNIEESLLAWARAPDPKARIANFITMLENMADDLAQYGCPVGTLSDELGKAHQPAQAQARALFGLYLEWLTAQFSALMPTAPAQEAAEHLLTMAQGASLLAHSFGSSALLKRQTVAMRHWLLAL